MSIRQHFYCTQLPASQALPGDPSVLLWILMQATTKKIAKELRKLQAKSQVILHARVPAGSVTYDCCNKVTAPFVCLSSALCGDGSPACPLAVQVLQEHSRRLHGKALQIQQNQQREAARRGRAAARVSEDSCRLPCPACCESASQWGLRAHAHTCQVSILSCTASA